LELNPNLTWKIEFPKEENSTNVILQCKILWLLWHLSQTLALFFAATKTQTQNGIRAPKKQIGNPAL
jgi:hypothetical protein